jgi:hypothetical protein
MGCTRPIRVLVFIRADSTPMYMAGIENGMDGGEIEIIITVLRIDEL